MAGRNQGATRAICRKLVTPRAIRAASDRLQARLTAKTCAPMRPWRRTKAFWAPIATIRLRPVRRPVMKTERLMPRQTPETRQTQGSGLIEPRFIDRPDQARLRG